MGFRVKPQIRTDGMVFGGKKVGDECGEIVEQWVVFEDQSTPKETTRSTSLSKTNLTWVALVALTLKACL